MLCHPDLADGAQFDVFASGGASPYVYCNDYHANDPGDSSHQSPHTLIFGRWIAVVQGIVPLERGVMRPPDLAHAAFAKEGGDFVRADAATKRESQESA